MNITGKELRLALRAADLSQERAATMLEVSRQTLSTWLGKAELSNEQIEKVKTTLNIDLQTVRETGVEKIPRFESNAHLLGEAVDPIYSQLVPLGNNKYGLTVPMVPVKAYAGYIDNYGDPEFYEQLEKHTITVIGNYRAEYFSFVVKVLNASFRFTYLSKLVIKPCAPRAARFLLYLSPNVIDRFIMQLWCRLPTITKPV